MKHESNQRHLLKTEVRVICAIAGEWKKTRCQSCGLVMIRRNHSRKFETCFKMGCVPDLMGLFYQQGTAGVETTGKTSPVDTGETACLLEPSRCMSLHSLRPSAT